MTKTELYNAVKTEVAELLTNSDAIKKNHSEALIELLNDKVFDKYLAPKRRVSEFEDYVDEETGETMHYCLWHKKYEPITEFSTKNGKAVGECKEAVKEWHKYAKAIKDIEAEIGDLINKVLDDEISNTEAKALRDEKLAKIESLKNARLEKINFEDYLAIS